MIDILAVKNSLIVNFNQQAVWLSQKNR